MSGLGDAQQVLTLLEEINMMLGQVEQKTQTLETKEPQIEKQAFTMQQATRILYRLNHLMVHMGLGENVNAAIAQLQRMVFMMRMVQMSMRMIAWGTPYGALFGVLGLTTVAITSMDMKLQDDVFMVGE